MLAWKPSFAIIDHNLYPEYSVGEFAACVNRGGIRMTTYVVGESQAAISLAALMLAACGGGGGGVPPPTYTVAGTVSGLAGSGLVLTDNGGAALAVSSNGSFKFTSRIAAGSPYSISVKANPTDPIQLCVVSNGSGVAGSTNVTDVAVTCTTTPLALFAGNLAGPGTVDGVGAAARFNNPIGLAIDVGGDMYVADTDNHAIRKITPTGVVTTLAGQAGISGSTDGIGPEARFSSPEGIAIDTTGTIYIADTGNVTIRKVTPTGAVTTFAGTAGAPGADDGIGAAARFSDPIGLAVDAGGDVYVADSEVDTIRKITATAVVTTLAGQVGISGSADGIGAAARFNGPTGIATDAAGNVYVADRLNSTIRKVTPAGLVTTLAGQVEVSGIADGVGASAQFALPFGTATDAAGNVYVADNSGDSIRKVTSAGVVTTLASGLVSDSNLGIFNDTGLTIDPAGNLYIADTSSTIRKITPTGRVTTLAGRAAVSGSANGIGPAAQFTAPQGIATDAAGNVYVAEILTIRKITPTGVVTTLAKDPFQRAIDVATDVKGNVYVTEGTAVSKITPAGVVTTLAGVYGVVGSADGIGASAEFFAAQGVAADAAGNLYIADTENYEIRKITPTGLVTTLAGQAGNPGIADGVGAAAQFTYPWSIAIDPGGIIYVTDKLSHTIRRITATGVVTTLAGQPGVPGSADGIGAAARFNNPTGIATDATGNVYVADNISTIRRITPTGVVSTVVGVPGQVGFSAGALPGIIGYPNEIAISGTSLYITLYNGVAIVQGLQ
jgi:sugar lactone lactonase YvrE